MKVRDADILFVPGHAGAGPGHWQSRWQERLSSARKVEPADLKSALPPDWTGAVADAVNGAQKPVVLVAHSLGVASVVAASRRFVKPVAGAFLVAPPDISGSPSMPEHLRAFDAYSRAPLPFPSILVASRSDPGCAFEVAEELGAAWGSLFVDAGAAGHIDVEAGYGPWPEGSMTFAHFMSRL